MLRFLVNRWSWLCLAVLIVGVGGGSVAVGEHAAAEQQHGAQTIDGRRVLPAPGLDGWNQRQRAPRNNPSKAERFGSAFQYDAFIYDAVSSRAAVAGVVRRGSVLEVGEKVSGSGCTDGTWYEAIPFGYLCTALGFQVSDTPSTNRYGVPPANVDHHLPYQYSRVITKRAPRYYRIPTAQEEAEARRAMENHDPPPEVVSTLMEGDYFLALAEKETRKTDGSVFYRTVRGRFVREADVELRNPEAVRGEELDVSAFPLRRGALASPEPNLYFGAALLRVFGEQCPDIDRAFDSAPHRHAVSHFVWGDRVGDAGPEDRILTARRRLLNSHARLTRGGRGLGGISFSSPLDGYPRIATSGLGEPRDNGRRLHRGIDFASELGEPVRSVAAGTVTFAGIDWERRAHIPLEPWGAVIVHQRHMGPRGLFVEIDHGNGVVSLYAHLGRYDVKVGDQVQASQRIGEVGRTGIRESAPHLHFGLFQNGVVLDPLDHLGAYVFPPNLTRRGHAGLETTTQRTERDHR
jgi:murein DD-endopeptidase MepM/ murein hydrolase activator NlpD